MANLNVSYFKNILKKENENLMKQCKHWQNIIVENEKQPIPENALGEIRTSIGLTELLLDQKLKQFGGLIADCENKTGEIEITCSDLQGFWDMVYHEVEKVNNKFKDLEIMKKNKWEIKEESTLPLKKSKIVKTKPVKAKPNTQAKSSGAVKAHILAARQRLAEAKAKVVKAALPGTMEGKENLICISVADSTVDDTVIEKANKIQSEKKKRANENPSMTPPKRHAGNKAVKEIIPLACVTRSAAKRALANYNKS